MNRTLVISEVFPPKNGGSGRWLWELYRRWSRGSVQVLAGDCAGASHFDRTHDLPIERMNLTFPSWGVAGFSHARRYMQAFHKIASVVRSGEITQIHCGRLLPEGLIALMAKLRFGLPYACYVHGEELNTAATSRELSFLTRRVLRGARVLIANSANTARILMEQWQVEPARLEIIHPGVDVSAFAVAERNEEIRRELGWSDRRVMLTVGRLQARKGHARLLAALPAIIERIPDALYAIVGEGEMRSELEQMIAQRNLNHHVQFVGEPCDEKLQHCMQQCDLFVLPNVQIQGDFEGFGMVLVEAQACGKPVVAGRSGGTSETMRELETGRLVDCENGSELASMVTQLLADEPLRQRMGAAGRRLVERKFDWSIVTAKAKAVFADRFGDRSMKIAA